MRYPKKCETCSPSFSAVSRQSWWQHTKSVKHQIGLGALNHRKNSGDGQTSQNPKSPSSVVPYIYVNASGW